MKIIITIEKGGQRKHNIFYKVRSVDAAVLFVNVSHVRSRAMSLPP